MGYEIQEPPKYILNNLSGIIPKLDRHPQRQPDNKWLVGQSGFILFTNTIHECNILGIAFLPDKSSIYYVLEIFTESRTKLTITSFDVYSSTADLCLDLCYNIVEL